MEKSSYYLSNRAYFCLADNHYVFLDLRSDEYLCLGRTHTDAVMSLLNDYHAVETQSVGIRLHHTSDANSSAVIQALVKKGLLVENAADGKPPAPARVNLPSTSTAVGNREWWPEIRPSHVWSFFAAAAIASRDLRWRSIERIVLEVEGRKATHTTTTTALDDGVITHLFEIFHRLRPYYPRPYLCMFESLALLHFLARFRVFPQWVFGVKLEPFAAHCWVQAGDIVVNDIVDNVRDYTPIMSL